MGRSASLTADVGSVAVRTVPPISTSRWMLRLFGAGFVGAFLWSWFSLDMSIISFFAGLGDVRNLLGRMFPPDFSNWSTIVNATFETLWMAVIGTFVSALVCVPLAFGAASNTTPHAVVRYVCRGIISLTRAVPEIIFAALFVVVLSIGPLPGILAIAIHSIGMIGKLFADAIEQTQASPREAITSVGARRLQTTVSSIVPQAMPSMIATAMYRLEINIRASSVLGLVGAGGIGFVIQDSLRSLDYQAALAAVACIFVLITAIELISAQVRQSLLGENTNVLANRRQSGYAKRKVARDTARNERAIRDRSLTPPWTSERILRTSSAVVAGLMLIVAFLLVDMPLLGALPRYPDLILVLGDLFPPDFSTARDELVKGMTESVQIAFVATGLGLFLSVPLGILGARNIVVRRVIVLSTRVTLLLLRGIPELIVAVIFVSAMGLGPVPGTLALTLVTATFTSKLFADTLEEVDPSPREALVAVGASRVQEFVAAVVPQALPGIVSQTLYILDVNLRSSTVLGIVGGGGIGFLLLGSLRVLEYQTTGAVVLSIFLIVYFIELVGSIVRRLLR
ncbi:MAG: phosphonate ABC transporter, permease protein PhnE [Actinobacteria bacterium]|jgi:phosphonate transport system permease protein|nr:phosphonate ABC transporter, permease protein PhnE [Actinomycetota bacterium]NBR66269.1 phosphonate ABC transporter, permease protein PhnE [Actinomycetota bacterium]NBU15604.1 phosphonate ABC transporter, permease protein PhnE [Actinomycetota bacterium]